jgi:CHAT domain-containing protein/ankyrin repeat protein
MKNVLQVVLFLNLYLFNSWCVLAQATPDETLISAIQQKNSSLVKQVIAKGADVNKVGKYAYVPLNWAINIQSPEIIQLLVEKGANPNYKSPQGQSLIFQPCMLNWHKTVKALLESGADANSLNVIKATPLISSAQSGATECVALLIPKTKDLEAKDLTGMNALHYAVQSGKLPLLELVANAKVNLNATDLQQRTGLHIATDQSLPNLAIIQKLIEKGMDLEAKDYSGNTALHLASEDNKIELCQLLAKAGASLEAKNGSGETALALAKSNNHTELANFLQNPTVNNSVGDSNSEAVPLAVLDTKLRQALKVQDLDLVKKLIAELKAKGADLERKSKVILQTPLLDFLSINPNFNITKLLVESGVTISATNYEGQNGLHLIMDRMWGINGSNEYQKIANLLISKGLKVNLADNEGNTALMLASERANLQAGKWLLENGAKLDLKNKEGKTAQEIAFENSRIEMAVFLQNPKDYRDDIVWKARHVFPAMETKAKPLSELLAEAQKSVAVVKSNQEKVFQLGILANLQFSAGKYDEAENNLLKAVEIAQSSQKQKAEALANLLGFYLKKFDLVKAETTLKKGLDLLSQLPDSTKVKLQTLEAEWNRWNGDLAKTNRFYSNFVSKNGLQTDSENGSSGLQLAYLTASEHYLRQGDQAKTNILIQTAHSLAISTYGIAHPKSWEFQYNYGRFWYEVGNPLQAQGHLMESLGQLATRFGTSHPDYLRSVHLMAKVQLAMGNLSASEIMLDDLQKAYLTNYGENYLPYLAISADLAQLYFSEGNYEKAWKSAQITSRKLTEISSEHPLFLKLNHTIAEIKFADLDPDDFGSFEIQLKNSARMAEKYYGLSSIPYLKASGNLAKLYLYSLQTDKFSASEQLLKSNLEKMEAKGLENALAGFNVFDGLDLARFRSYLAMLYHEKDEEKLAEFWYQKTLQTMTIPLDNLERAGWLVDFARLKLSKSEELVESNHLLQGVEMYERLIDKVFPSLSEKEKEWFFASVKEDFNLFNYFVLQKHKSQPDLLSDMYNHQLRTKALILTSTKRIRESILASGDEKLIANYKKWKALREYLANLNLPEAEIKKQGINLDSLEETANQLEKEIAIESTDFASQTINSKKTWRDVQSKLQPNECAIEIIRIGHGKKAFYVALLVTSETKDHPELVELPKGNSLEGKFLKFYRTAIEYKIEDGNSYKKYWLPIQKALDGNGTKIEKVYFSPDGIYNQINPKGFKNTKTGKFLLDEIQFETVTRTDDLLSFTGGEKPLKGKAFLLGKPVYNIVKDGVTDSNHKTELAENRGVYRTVRMIPSLRDATFAELPGTEKEVEGIAKVLTEYDWQVRKKMGESATEQAIKQAMEENWEILHIATHGFFIGETTPDTSEIPTSERAFKPIKQIRTIKGLDPMLQSGVILAGVNNFNPNKLNSEDGILTAYEAMNLDLSGTELVVLSACETGLGEIQNGEGVYGLQRALKVAGAKAIVISLWKVSDDATQLLMNEFYTNWLKLGNKRRAFEQAQQTVKLKYPEPYFWSAFVMVGE